MSGIREKTGQIASRRAAEKEANRQRMYDAFKTGAGMFAQSREAEKGREAKASAAELLAGAREKEMADVYGIGFEQEKELEKLRADSRSALAKLEASFRQDGDPGDFDIDEAFTRVMSFAVLGRPGEEWSMSWQPKEWTQEEKDRMLQKINQRISQYGEDGAAVQAMVDSYLAEFDYLFPEAAAEGVDAITGAAPYGDWRRFFSGLSGTQGAPYRGTATSPRGDILDKFFGVTK